MTMTAPSQVTDRTLEEIAHRLNSPMTEDGLRAWYYNDAGALLGEVIYLRRTLAQATAMLSGPPLEDVAPGTPILQVAERLAAVWQQHVDGLWKAAELRLMRGKLQAATTRATEAEAKAHELKNEVTALRLELGEAKKAHERLVQVEAARVQLQQSVDGLTKANAALQTEVAGLTKEREELRTNRERLIQLLQAEADKAERMRVLAVELSSVSSG